MVLSLLFAAQMLVTAPWYEQKMEGWYYFQDPAEAAEPLTPPVADEILDGEKKKLQELLSLAILSPTKENVANYLEAKRIWSQQSALFAEACGENLLPPEDQFFLLLFYRGEEDIEAAETARKFAGQHHWTLKAVSLDGETIDGLDSIEDEGISKRFGVNEAPSLFLVDPAANRIARLGSGDMSLDELEAERKNHE